MALTRIAILASGSGTTAEAFIEAVAKKEVVGEIALVIVNNSKAAAFDRVRAMEEKYNLGIKIVHIGKKNFPAEKDEEVEYGHQTKAEEEAILKALNQEKIDLVLLMGYMKLIGKSIVDKYGWQEGYGSIYEARMLNTHPGLLPATKGLYGVHVQESVLESKTQAGHCIFAVDSKYDDGPVIAKHQVPVMASDTAESLFERVKKSEKDNLVRDISEFIIEQKKYLGVK